MTKEEFISRVLDMCIYGGDSIVAKQFFDEFFESNVVIPKGENVTIQCLSKCTNEWVDVANFIGDVEYRIKPQEPVYEYLWMELRTPDTYGLARNKYMTEEEAIEYFNDSTTYFAVKETRRERK